MPDEFQRLTRGLPFRMAAPRLPTLPARTFSIARYGAAGDGQTSNTTAFSKAIQASAQSGGGRVVVPRGLWLTGATTLAGNVDLHLEAGAVGRGLPRPDRTLPP